MPQTRRSFLQKSATIAASTLYAPSILTAESLKCDKIRVAIIGIGGRGREHVKCLRNEQLVAFCDVDYQRSAKTINAHPNIPRFDDFRVMFDQMGSRIDAVSIATPDHMHYPIALWAIANGKHILVEKPLVRTFAEAMHLKQVAKKAGVITQMGNQGHASEGLRRLKEWIMAGLIGEVDRVVHWTNRPTWPQGMTAFPSDAAVPHGLNWNLWQGVAPPRPYAPNIAPFKWRGYRDYGCGAIGDIACHSMDASYTGLDLKFPHSLKAQSSGMTEIAFPKESTIEMKFMPRTGGREITVRWLDGGRMPSKIPFVPEHYYRGREATPSKQAKQPLDNGTFIVGTKGTISVDMYSQNPRIFPTDYHKQLIAEDALPPATLPRVNGDHFNEWAEGIRNSVQPGANIVDYAADFTATALLGAVSLTSTEALEFDSSTQRFLGNDSMNHMLKSEYEYRQEFLP